MSIDTKFKVPKNRTVTSFTNLLTNLLPVGILWRQLNESFTDLLESFAVELNRLDQRCIDIQNEAVPGLSTDADLLSDWERILLTEDEKPDTGVSEAVRQSIVDTKYYLQTTNVTIANLTAYALALGITITFGDVDRFRVGTDRAGDRIRGAGASGYIWIVNHSGGTADQQQAMKAYFEGVKPAHSIVEFNPPI